MNDIRQPGLGGYNSFASIGQIQQVGAPSVNTQAAGLENLLDRTLGAQVLTGSLSGHTLSLDDVMSGSLTGYMGLGEVALDDLESPIASAQMLGGGMSVASNTIQIPSMGSEVAMAPVIQIPSMGKNVEMAPAIQIPRAGEGMAAAGGIETLADTAAPPVSAVPGEMLADLGNPDAFPSETLAAADPSFFGDVAFGLVPGVSLNPSQQQTFIGLSDNMTDNSVAFEQVNARTDMVIGNIPMETLASWDNTAVIGFSDEAAGEMAMAGGLTLEVPSSLSALDLETGSPFDAKTMASVPAIEGSRAEYASAWDEIHDTLSSYSGTETSGFLGISDWLNSPQNNSGLGLNTDSNAPDFGALGLNNAADNNIQLSYRSMVDRELLGFIDLSSYGPALALNSNPTTQVSSLWPSKYMSGIINGYFSS